MVSHPSWLQFLVLNIFAVTKTISAPPWSSNWQLNSLSSGGWSMPWAHQSWLDQSFPPVQLPHLPSSRRGNSPNNNNNNINNSNDIKTFWLIPRDPINCLPSDKRSPIAVNKDKVTVQDCHSGSRTLKFPGCVFVRSEIEVLEPLSSNLFANVQFQWANLPQLASGLRCEQQEPNGCNGIGNNCYYCDICQGIQELQRKKGVTKNESFECPRETKTYLLERQFNVSNWKGLDENGNGVIDFLEDENLRRIREYLKAIDVIGFGTLSITFQLAYNATATQKKAKDAEERRIKQDVYKKYRFAEKSAYEIERESREEINYWHKNNYLPWLLSSNQLACTTFIFDICLNQPSPFSLQQSYQCL